MGIKNWTVTVETVKSVGARECYFENKDEPSHENSVSLTAICNDERASMRMIKLCEQAKAKQRQARKGGRPPTAAMEFVFALPSDLPDNGTDQDWIGITKDMIKSLAESVGADPNELVKVCRGSLHREPVTDSENATKGTHLHLMVGKILPDGTPMPKLQQSKALYAVKQAFNDSVLDRLGHSHEMYVARTNSNKKRYKNKFLNTNAAVAKAVKSVQRNCTRMTEYLLDENWARVVSTQSRLDKAVKAMEELELDDAIQIDPQQSKMLDLLKNQVEALTQQSTEAIELASKENDLRAKRKMG